MAAEADAPLPRAVAETLLAERIAAVPHAIHAAFSAPPPSEIAEVLAAPRFIVTGGGFSEGPARVLATLLDRAGRPARYLPLSSFAATEMPRSDAALILFSQGLAPNARLPLAHLQSFQKTLIFTSVNNELAHTGSPLPALADALSRRGVVLWRHPPLCEDRLLVRIVGPAAALACALRFVQLCERNAATITSEAPFFSAPTVPIDLLADGKNPLALIVGGELCELAFPLRWKLLEGLRVCDPSVWDFLQVIHGPLQSFYGSPLTLVTVERAAHPHERVFADRLAALLHPERHRLVRLTLPAHTAPFVDTTQSLLSDLLQLDAHLNAALLHTVRTHAIELGNWPLRNRDGALYAIDPSTLNLPHWDL